MTETKYGNYMNLRLELRRVGVTQKEVAEHLGLSKQSINNKLAGKTAFTAREIVDIRDTFTPDATLDYLLEVVHA